MFRQRRGPDVGLVANRALIPLLFTQSPVAATQIQFLADHLVGHRFHVGDQAVVVDVQLDEGGGLVDVVLDVDAVGLELLEDGGVDLEGGVYAEMGRWGVLVDVE